MKYVYPSLSSSSLQDRRPRYGNREADLESNPINKKHPKDYLINEDGVRGQTQGR
jgi:hypothetical protein